MIYRKNRGLNGYLRQVEVSPLNESKVNTSLLKGKSTQRYQISHRKFKFVCLLLYFPNDMHVQKGSYLRRFDEKKKRLSNAHSNVLKNHS